MADTGSLKRSVLTAVGWATATRLAGQLANWAMTLATVRFLRPQDYGLMAVTIAITGFLQSLSYVGFADAIVQSRRLGDEDLRGVFGLILTINAIGLVLLCALAYPAAWFYGEPRLAGLLLAASLVFIAVALQAVPRALLEKKLDLKRVTRIDLASNILSGTLVLLLAWAGAGVWSLLSGLLFRGILQAIGFGFAAPYFRRPRFTLRNLSEVLHFGGLRTAENLLWTFYASADVFVIGKLLGADILGIYSVARTVAALPVEKLSGVVKPIAFPAFAQVQDNRDEALHYLQKATRLLGFLCFPVFFGIAATAPQIVSIALGPKWTQATLPLVILAIAMALRPIGILIPSFLIGIGQIRASFKNTLFATILYPLAFAVGSHWGLIGVCAAWLVATPIQLLVLLRRVAIITGITIFDLIAPLLPPLAGSLVMYASVRAIDVWLPTAGSSAAPWLVVSGVLVYLGYAALFMRPLATELVALARH
ncbi:MAG TPA: lipopolysaccharide biosynthesis protein [Stellaceae bacterium]|jgi:O-antigen/teichoic acid export membrane protein